MPRPTLVLFHVAHVQGLVDRDGAGSSLTALIAEHHNGPAVTGMVDGRVIGCAGLALQWPGMATAWMLLSPEIGEHGIWMTRMTRRMLRDWTRAYDLHRVEAVSLQSSRRNQEWLEALGFARERDGIARAYTPDRRDMARYELVEE